ncbi:MAG: DUF4956 domain-containing protein [Rhodospirillaceae bacterium]|jgi:hypothetical protein|nr:DUF4956 domain-containing protein [Rhodospirillaceae bacterium]|tara:strand:- start:607 stop:1278 length:672 start_codon:yes stop_codon:yes gene_type:complete
MGVPQLQAISFSTLDLLMTLSLAFTLGIWTVFVYRISHQGLTYERSFLVSLVLMPPIVAVVMMFIGSNLALSLGMIGALSIIRFRTVIKDSRDMIYLFWAIAIGLGTGTLNWGESIIACMFLGGALLLIHFFHFGERQRANFILVMNGEGPSIKDGIIPIVSEFVSYSSIRSMELKEDGWEMVIELTLDDPNANIPRQLLEKVRAVPGVGNASLLAPHLSLPI